MSPQDRAAAADAEDPHFLSIDHVYGDPRVHVEALDAHDAWPPLLRPGVMAGHDAYTLWEIRLLHECLEPVSGADFGSAPALATALCWTDRLRQWRPADGAFIVLTGKPFHRRDAKWLRFCQKPERGVLETLLQRLMLDVPAQWQVPQWPLGLPDEQVDDRPVTRTAGEAVLARYLGTRLIASWVAYQGNGLRSVLASLVSAHALAALALSRNGKGPVTVGRLTAAIRAADWLLLHLLDRDQWATWCSTWEAPEDSRPLLGLVTASQAHLDELTWTS